MDHLKRGESAVNAMKGKEFDGQGGNPYWRRTGSGSTYTYASTRPRRPCTAFGLYLQDHYLRLRKHFFNLNPQGEQRQILRYCATVWRKWVTQEEYDRYVQWAKADQERVRKERVEWMNRVRLGLTPFVPACKPKPPGYPRMTRNAFMFFAAEHRPRIRDKNPNMMACEVMKEIAARWALLDSDGKARYFAMSAADKDRYQQGKIRFREAERFRKQAVATVKQRERLNKLFRKALSSPVLFEKPQEDAVDAQ